MGWGISPRDPQSISLDVSYHKEQQYVLLYGLGLGICMVSVIIRPFINKRWRGIHPGDTQSMSLDASYY